MREKPTYREKFVYDFKRSSFEYVVTTRRSARTLLNMKLIDEKHFNNRLAYCSLLVEQIRAATDPQDLSNRMDQFKGILANG